MRYALSIVLLFTLFSCKNTRVSEHAEWGAMFRSYGIDSACFIMRDHVHETVHLFNRPRCLERFTPASTFKIFNSLIAVETSVARDETMVIPWDKVPRRPEWDKDMDMREAFRVSNFPWYQQLAQRIGKQNYQHYLDTTKYGNMKMGPEVNSFWVDNSLQISADEQVGFVRKLYFDELPFLVRSQSIVKNLMLREDSTKNRFYYKTGTGTTPRGTTIYWVVGFLEHVVQVKEEKESMNKSGVRNYPYFFALNFERPASDTSRDWNEIRLKLLHIILNSYGATRDE